MAACASTSTSTGESASTSSLETARSASTTTTSEVAPTPDDPTATTATHSGDEPPLFEPELGGFITTDDFAVPAWVFYPDDAVPEGRGLGVEGARLIGIRSYLCGETPNPLVVEWSHSLTLDVVGTSRLFYVQTASFDSKAEALQNFEDLTAAYLKCHDNGYVGEHDWPVYLQVAQVPTSLEAPVDAVTGYLVQDTNLRYVTSTSCAAFAQLSALGELDDEAAKRLIKERFNYYEQQDYAEHELRLIIESLMGTYCPGVAEVIPHVLGERGAS